jgi:methylated-DNA-[protein]-cysteine S-methyltransferase
MVVNVKSAPPRYTTFDTAVGRCCIVWTHLGVLGVQLPEAREIETRGRVLRQYSQAREHHPPPEIEIAIDGIVALLRGEQAELSDVTLDLSAIRPFDQRVYAYARTIPRGETRTYSEVAASLRVPGAMRSVSQAIGRNPFVIIVPCHRVLEPGNYADKISPNGGAISKRRLLSIEGVAGPTSKSLFDVLLPVAPPRLQN